MVGSKEQKWGGGQSMRGRTLASRPRPVAPRVLNVQTSSAPLSRISCSPLSCSFGHGLKYWLLGLLSSMAAATNGGFPSHSGLTVGSASSARVRLASADLPAVCRPAHTMFCSSIDRRPPISTMSCSTGNSGEVGEAWHPSRSPRLVDHGVPTPGSAVDFPVTFETHRRSFDRPQSDGSKPV